MPIYMEVDGIKGDVRSNRAGGANFAMSDGSVKNINRLPGGGPRVTVFDAGSISRSSSGHKFTLERHFDGVGAPVNAIGVARISLPNSPNDAIDALAPNAVVKARALFEAQRSRVTSLVVVFSTANDGANKLRHTNNLRQLSLAALRGVSTVKLLVTDNSNPNGVIIMLENVLLTEPLFNPKLAGEGKKVLISFCKTGD